MVLQAPHKSAASSRLGPQSQVPTMHLEREQFQTGALWVAGVDEVGRGALAGPVMVGIVIVGQNTVAPPDGLRDSKLLTGNARAGLVPLIETWAAAWVIAEASANEIDKLGIIGALRLATHRGLVALARQQRGAGAPDVVILDGNHDWLTGPPQMPQVVTQVQADQHCASVAAASVLAKQHRDAHMMAIAAQFPEYGFERNKGYGSADHMAALAAHGPSRYHRRSWNLPGG